MLETTHRRIAEEIAKILELSERETNLLETGSIHPDNWADFPHHQGKEMEIAENILNARKLYLEKDDECFFRLGVALHYIADRWTYRPRTSEKHNEWEELIEKAPILDNSQLEEVIKKMPMPSKEVDANLAQLRIFKSLVEFAFVKIDPKKYERVALEEAAARELMELRGYGLLKREEIKIDSESIESLIRESEDLDKLGRYALTLTGPFSPSLFPLNIITLTVNTRDDTRKVLIWCVLTQKLIEGDWLLRRMKRVMKESGAENGIMITSGRFTQEAQVFRMRTPLDLRIVTHDLCVSIAPHVFRLSTWSNPIIDVNFAYRVCLEVARLVFS